MSAEDVVNQYFAAFARRDADAMAAMWAPDGIDRLAGRGELVGPNGVREYFIELFGAFGDLAITVQSTTVQDDRVAVHWTATGTMTGPLQGIEPTGARVELEGLDLVHVEDGRLVHNLAIPDNLGIARQIGLLPPYGSTAEKRLNAAFNAGTRATRRAAASRELERVADGVWILRGGIPRLYNVYFLEDGDGVTLFDAGIEAMARPIAAAAAQLGGIKRIVLSHADADHRGAAPQLRAPVYIHPADRSAAESDAPTRDYHHIERLGRPARWVYPSLFRFWDGGAVTIDGTVEEGDDVAGFQVVHLPGHAPGLIGLFRERDRLALSSDCFYALDIETTIKGPPRVPHRAFNQDEEQARASMRKLAALEPSAAWPAHADPLTGDVRAQLERAAAG
jgi:glyoxylase-like metal-dependent hydrolase (beta-lactamase superfamily II)/predicted ester cyclase